MSSLLKHLIEGTEDKSDKSFVVASRMRKFVGRTLYSVRRADEKKIGDKTFEVFVVESHKIAGTSSSNLSELLIEGHSLKEHYLRENQIRLLHLDIPGFLCFGGHILVPELCHEEYLDSLIDIRKDDTQEK
jgi:hypothetical protein